MNFRLVLFDQILSKTTINWRKKKILDPPWDPQENRLWINFELKMQKWKKVKATKKQILEK